MLKENIHIRHILNHPNGEYKIPGTRYRADGYCEETNTIYEFHGDCWHGNPEIYAPDDYLNFYRPDTPASVLYQETIEKEKYIQDQGYNLIVIWRSNYLQSLQK